MRNFLQTIVLIATVTALAPPAAAGDGTLDIKIQGAWTPRPAALLSRLVHAECPNDVNLASHLVVVPDRGLFGGWIEVSVRAVGHGGQENFDDMNAGEFSAAAVCSLLRGLGQIEVVECCGPPQDEGEPVKLTFREGALPEFPRSAKEADRVNLAFAYSINRGEWSESRPLPAEVRVPIGTFVEAQVVNLTEDKRYELFLPNSPYTTATDDEVIVLDWAVKPGPLCREFERLAEALNKSGEPRGARARRARSELKAALCAWKADLGDLLEAHDTCRDVQQLMKTGHVKCTH